MFDSDGNVVLSGERYPLCATPLPNLIPWVEDTLSLRFDPNNKLIASYPPPVTKSLLSEASLHDALRSCGELEIWVDDVMRLRHSHGHSQEEMYALRFRPSVETPFRVCDAVLKPQNAEQIFQIVQTARVHGWKLVPYGGGTNVSQALSFEGVTQPVVVLSMASMNRVLWIDEENQLACIQAGAVGRDIQKCLAQFGYTIGHEPDSIEFSTMGGWVATNASGMKKNKYGNIEDIVRDIEVVTHEGCFSHRMVAPRESTGVDLRKLFFGSEGNFGVITEATVRISKLPEVQEYGSILFKTFSEGARFMRELAYRNIAPASVRLVDNQQFRFSMALKPKKSLLPTQKSKLEKLFVTKLKGFDPETMCAATLVFEGSAQEVKSLSNAVYACAAEFGGMAGGAENGAKGYQLTYGIAYIRDFVMPYKILAESFETSVPWNRVEELCRRTKERLHREHRERGLPGTPFVTCRVTQVYPTGACIYFYLAFSFDGVDNPTQIFSELEHAAREEILACGGSLSHHHGVGRLRAPFMKEAIGVEGVQIKGRIKDALDPEGVFGVGTQGLL